jgi:hypothetical protein
MKRLATFALITTALAGVALAQTRRISLVKDTPTNYGLYGFDISWVDNSTQKYYLTDRTNNAIDLGRASVSHVRFRYRWFFVAERLGRRAKRALDDGVWLRRRFVD